MFIFRLILITCLLVCSNIEHAHALCFHNCAITDEGKLIIKQFEGYSAFVYKDVAGIPTIGFGHALRPGEKIRTPLLGPDALKLLEADIDARLPRLNRLIKIPLQNNQFDALMSFMYNLGEARLASSTLLRKVNAGLHDEVPAQFKRWDKAGEPPVPFKGLTIRRETEASHYEGDL